MYLLCSTVVILARRRFTRETEGVGFEPTVSDLPSRVRQVIRIEPADARTVNPLLHEIVIEILAASLPSHIINMPISPSRFGSGLICRCHGSSRIEAGASKAGPAKVRL
jgi:hypothetical protein